MDEAEVVIVARRRAYRTTSLALLIVVLLVLLVAGVVLPLFWLPVYANHYRWGTVRALPWITDIILFHSYDWLYLMVTGFCGTVLAVKEILAAPIVRFWTNFIALVLLLIWTACYVVGVAWPVWKMFVNESCG